MHITDPFRTHTTVPHGWSVCSLGPIRRTWKRSFSGPDERLTSGMQTFAGAVANVCGNGCNALRLSWEWLENGLYVSDYQALRRRKIRAKRWRCLFLMIGSQESGIHKAHFCLLRVGQMPFCCPSRLNLRPSEGAGRMQKESKRPVCVAKCQRRHL